MQRISCEVPQRDTWQACKNPSIRLVAQQTAVYLFLEPDRRLVRVSEAVEQADAAGTEMRPGAAPPGPKQGHAREQDGVEGEASREGLVGAGGQEEVHGDRDERSDARVDPGVAR